MLAKPALRLGLLRGTPAANLDECWRPAFARFLQVRFTAVRRELASDLHSFNHHRAHTGRITAGRCPADVLYRAGKTEPR